MPQPKATFTITAINRTKKAFDEINTSMVAMAKRAGVVGAAISATMGAFVAGSNAAARSASRLKDTTDLLGLSSVEALQQLAAAGEQVDISFEQTAVAIQRLARRSQDAVEGSQQLRDAFADFGVTVAELEVLAPDEIFLDMAAGLDEARAAGVDLSSAMTVLDTEGIQLIRTMERLNSEGFQKSWAIMEETGAVMDEELTEKAQKVRAELTAIQQIISTPFKKALVEASNAFLEWAASAAGGVREVLADYVRFFQVVSGSEDIVINMANDQEERERQRRERSMENLAAMHTAELMATEGQYLTLQALADEHTRQMFGAEEERVAKVKAEIREEELERERAAGRLLTSAARNSKVFFELDKARAIAQAALSSREAVLGAYAVGARIGGPPLGAAFAAAAAAATAVQVAAIASQSYGAGGGGVATGGPGGQSATAGELAGTSYQPRQNITVEFQSGTGFYDENSVRRLIDTLREVEENGNPSLSGRFTVAG